MEIASKGLLKSSSALVVLMIIGYAISFMKESSIAYFFGVSKEVDAYTIAIQIPIILYSVFSVAIKSVLIPIYSKCIYNQSKDEADFFISNFISIVLLISIFLSIVGCLLAPIIIYIFSPGFDLYRHDLATVLLRYSFLTLFCIAFSEIVTGILNVHKKFSLPAIGIWIWNGSIIIFLVLLHSIGINSAIIGNAVGLLLEFVYMFFLLRKKVNYKFIVKIRDRRILEASRKTLPVMMGIGVAELNRLVDRMMASFVGVGAVSILNYASKINTVFASCLDQTVSVAAFPTMSEFSAKKDYTQLSKLINLCLSAYLLILTPITIYIALYNDVIVSLAFGRGKFTIDNITLTGQVLFLFALGLIFMPLRSIATNLYYSLGDTKTPSYNSMIGMLVNIGLNVILGYYLGVKGLALATSISYAVITILLLANLKKFSNWISVEYFYRNLYKPLLGGVFLLISFLLVKHIFAFDVFLCSFMSFILSLVIYILVLVLTKTKEIIYIINFLKCKLYGKDCNS